MSLNNKLPGLLMLDVKEPYEPSPTFALEPIGSSGDMTDKLGFLLSSSNEKGQACTHYPTSISGV